MSNDSEERVAYQRWMNTPFSYFQLRTEPPVEFSFAIATTYLYACLLLPLFLFLSLFSQIWYDTMILWHYQTLLLLSFFVLVSVKEESLIVDDKKKHERLHLTTMRRKFIRHFKCSNCVTCWFFTDLQLIASYNRSENSLRSINSLLLNKFEVLACQWCFLAQHSKYLTS